MKAANSQARRRAWPAVDRLPPVLGLWVSRLGQRTDGTFRVLTPGFPLVQWASARTPAKRGCTSEQPHGFGSSKMDHFDFCFPSATQAPTGVVPGSPPPARAPAGRFPARSHSASVCLLLSFSVLLLSAALSPFSPPLSSLLLAPGWPASFNSPPLLLLPASFCAGSCDFSYSYLRAAATFNATSTCPDGLVSLRSWPHAQAGV